MSEENINKHEDVIDDNIINDYENIEQAVDNVNDDILGSENKLSSEQENDGEVIKRKSSIKKNIIIALILIIAIVIGCFVYFNINKKEPSTKNVEIEKFSDEKIGILKHLKLLLINKNIVIYFYKKRY